MIPATSLPETAENNFNFLAIFNNSAKSLARLDSSESALGAETLSSQLVQRINQLNIISTVTSTVIPTGRLFLSTRFVITFRLTDRFAKNFVLLRGLFDFSRPKNIRITSNRPQQLFQIEVLESQADEVVTYIEIILESMTREIKFKEALKAIISFEKRIQQERAKLYSDVLHG